ncbi:uncharacterized protein LOC62_04G005374 [Vanrija pseudolonga]|uniref:Uncharacterized protein n=1 Tax=Vanrija pseudolonga TaxID=143232 RepID=A0AAF0Y9I7_9TREE|nr:hypothetical protein LOC62_04G005374 [Vanrija pseudolonga]
MSTAKEGITLDQVSPFHLLLVSAGSLALYAPLAGALARRYGKVSPEPELAALGTHPSVWGTLKRTWAAQGIRGVYRGTSVLLVRWIQVVVTTLLAAHAARPKAHTDAQTNHYLLVVALSLGLSVVATYPLFGIHVGVVLSAPDASTLQVTRSLPRAIVAGSAPFGASLLQAITAIVWTIHPVFWLAWPASRPDWLIVLIFAGVATGFTVVSLRYQGEAAGVVAAQLDMAERVGEEGAPLRGEA